MTIKVEGEKILPVREMGREKYETTLQRELQQWYADHKGQSMSQKVLGEIKSRVKSKFQKS